MRLVAPVVQRIAIGNAKFEITKEYGLRAVVLRGGEIVVVADDDRAVRPLQNRLDSGAQANVLCT